MKGVARRVLPWLPALVWAAAVWFIGGIRDMSSVPAIPGLDKLGHFAMYGVLGFLLGFGWVRSAAGSRWIAVVLVALALGLGVADERRQGRLAGRSEDPMDWLADALGVTTGFALAAWLYRRRNDTRTGS